MIDQSCSPKVVRPADNGLGGPRVTSGLFSYCFPFNTVPLPPGPLVPPLHNRHQSFLTFFNFRPGFFVASLIFPCLKV
ncbi:hypothetical protein J6590_050758 [Homalodisca vitripennis]|nr:hypothetical protein J6590_050758 [Homalodisca vitripennis]